MGLIMELKGQFNTTISISPVIKIPKWVKRTMSGPWIEPVIGVAVELGCFNAQFTCQGV